MAACIVSHASAVNNFCASGWQLTPSHRAANDGCNRVSGQSDRSGVSGVKEGYLVVDSVPVAADRAVGVG